MVVAPYATGLAAMVDPASAATNFRRFDDMDGRGVHGFYEALDFTRSRLQEDEGYAVVRNYMAHHQGMTIVAIANVLHHGRMRARFHREPMIKASELLLSERMPRGVATGHPRAEEVRASARLALSPAPVGRRLMLPRGGAPVTNLLSNGRYAVMLTASGGGYSRWRDIAVTRWREDATRDDSGAFVFLKDTQSGAIFSPTSQPLNEAAAASVIFAEDHAQYLRRDGSLSTEMDVLVSGEDDGEVHRISLANSGRRAREIEVTSYAELVLTTPAVDNAHPAFAKMFVQTEYLPEFGALVATRRRARTQRARNLGDSFRCRRRRGHRRPSIRIRSGQIPRSQSVHQHRRCGSWRTKNVRDRGHCARPGLLAATAPAHSARQGGARGLLDTGRIVSCRTARTGRQAP
jgi:cyclic beta-1,2-glucan synthetase